eukprot:scaffold37392_cov69-Phaeocystis_antarctica.AAC.1
MFAVRSSPCPAPNLQSRALPCTLCAPRSPAAASRLSPHLAAQVMPAFRLSAVCLGVQPAAGLRHLQRHEHELHVRGALLPVPCPIPAAEPSPCTPLPMHVRHLPPSGPHVVPHRMPSLRLSAVCVGVQPAAELQHLQRHGHERHVSGRAGVQFAAELLRG